MWVMLTSSRTTDLDSIRTYPVRAPRTHHSSHRGNFTDPPLFLFPLHDHSFIHSHACIHTFIHSFIHSSIHPIHPSIAYAIAASQRFTSRHEAAVVSFDMSGDQPWFKRPAHEGLKAASRQIELGEKNIDEPQRPCLTPLRSR